MKYNYINYFNIKNKDQDNLDEAPVMMAISATSLVLMAIRTYKDYLRKAARECKSLEGRDKNLCMLRHDIDALKAKNKKLMQGLNKCSKSRNKEKCEEKIKKEIEKTNEKIKKKQKQYRRVYYLAKQKETGQSQK